MLKEYKKPEMKFTEVCADQAIADTCWGLDGVSFNGKPGSANYCGPFYYDIEGQGYVSFSLKGAGGKCGAPDAFDVKLIVKNADGTTSSSDGSEYEAEVEAALKKALGGNQGQPYSGLTTDFPTTPNQMS